MIDPQADALARAIERLIVCYDHLRVHQTNLDLAKSFEPESAAKHQVLLDEAQADRDRALADLTGALAGALERGS